MDGNVRIGSLSIYGKRNAGTGRRGLFVKPEGITGWFSGVEPRRDSTAIPQGHGDFDVPPTLASRTIVVPGWAVAETREDLEVLRGRVLGVLADGGTEVMSVEYAGKTTWAYVRLGAGTKWSVLRDKRTVAEFQLTLWSPDPRRYGETRFFASGEAEFHRGNFSATPKYAIGGNMPNGYTLNGPFQRKYVVTAPVTPSSGHVIDMATGLLLIVGNVTYGAVTRADTWSIPPGQQAIVSLAPTSGSGTLEARVVDTHV